MKHKILFEIVDDKQARLAEALLFAVGSTTHGNIIRLGDEVLFTADSEIRKWNKAAFAIFVALVDATINRPKQSSNGVMAFLRKRFFPSRMSENAHE